MNICYEVSITSEVNDMLCYALHKIMSGNLTDEQNSIIQGIYEGLCEADQLILTIE